MLIVHFALVIYNNISDCSHTATDVPQNLKSIRSRNNFKLLSTYIMTLSVGRSGPNQILKPQLLFPDVDIIFLCLHTRRNRTSSEETWSVRVR